VGSIKGNPDIVFKKLKICVFLDSDFWHGWQYPRWKHLLKNDFWRDKIMNNRKRDRRNTIYLRNKGWNVIRFWEHQITRDKNRLINKIKKILTV
jgi:DNA mismatch endonuclease (patch repair protein)